MAFKRPNPTPIVSRSNKTPNTNKNRSNLGNNVSEELAVSEELSIEDCLTAIKKSQYSTLNIIPNKIQTYAKTHNVSLANLSDQKLLTFLKQNPLIESLLKDMGKNLLDIDPTYTSQLRDDSLSLSDFFNIVAEHVKLFPKTKTINLKEILKLTKKIDFKFLKIFEDIKTNLMYALYRSATKDHTEIIEPRNFEAFEEYKQYRPLAKAFNKNIPGKKPTQEMIDIGKYFYYQVDLMVQIDKNMMKDPFKLVEDFIKAYKGSKI